MTPGSPATHVRGVLRLVEDSTTSVPCTATSNLPEGYQGFAFFRRDLRLSLSANVVVPPARKPYSISQQKYQRQEAQQCQGGNHLVSRWKASS